MSRRPASRSTPVRISDHGENNHVPHQPLSDGDELHATRGWQEGDWHRWARHVVGRPLEPPASLPDRKRAEESNIAMAPGSATSWRRKRTGFGLYTGAEADAALRRTARLRVRPLRRRRQLPLHDWSAKPRASESQWGRPALSPCQSHGRGRSAPLRENSSRRCEPRLNTGGRYHLKNTPKHLTGGMFCLIFVCSMTPKEAD